jgi:putative flippase GtrA
MRLIELLARHQTGAITATAVDFLMMIGWVELAHGSPVTAVAVGATCGGVTSFLLGRRWIFRVTDRSAAAQALRYGLLSASSMGLNSLGEYLLLRALGLPYVLTRLMVAALVGLCWNFPLQRYFVFRRGKPAARPAAAYAGVTPT